MNDMNEKYNAQNLAEATANITDDASLYINATADNLENVGFLLDLALNELEAFAKGAPAFYTAVLPSLESVRFLGRSLYKEQETLLSIAGQLDKLGGLARKAR